MAQVPISGRIQSADDLTAHIQTVVSVFPPELRAEAWSAIIMAATVQFARTAGPDQAAILLIGGLLSLTDQGITGDLKLLLESNSEAKSLIEKLRGPLK
jgi:hypothetical protein